MPPPFLSPFNPCAGCLEARERARRLKEEARGIRAEIQAACALCGQTWRPGDPVIASLKEYLLEDR